MELHPVGLTRRMRPACGRAVRAICERICSYLPRNVVAKKIVEPVAALEAQLLPPLFDDVRDGLRLSRCDKRGQPQTRATRVDDRHRLHNLPLLRERLGPNELGLDLTRKAHGTR